MSKCSYQATSKLPLSKLPIPLHLSHILHSGFLSSVSAFVFYKFNLYSYSKSYMVLLNTFGYTCFKLYKLSVICCIKRFKGIIIITKMQERHSNRSLEMSCTRHCLSHDTANNWHKGRHKDNQLDWQAAVVRHSKMKG